MVELKLRKIQSASKSKKKYFETSLTKQIEAKSSSLSLCPEIYPWFQRAHHEVKGAGPLVTGNW